MITKENKTIYKCEHCSKWLQKKDAMERHEKFCGYNPATHTACAGCVHSKETTKDVLLKGDEYYPDSTRQAKSFYCDKLEKGMYPLKAVKKGLVEKYPETFEGEILMPNKCEFQKLTNQGYN